MICAHAASYALMIGVLSARPQDERSKLGNGTLSIALLLGFAPAAVLGIPGLSGLAAAVAVSLGVIAYLNSKARTPRMSRPASHSSSPKPAFTWERWPRGVTYEARGTRHRAKRPADAHALASPSSRTMWDLPDCAGWGLSGRRREVPEKLSVHCFGLQFAHPLGLAAGFDKNGDYLDAWVRWASVTSNWAR